MGTQLKEVWRREPLGPWRGKVTIHAMTGRKTGRRTSLPYETLFQVVAEWQGPPPAWMPTEDAGRVQAQDLVVLHSYIAAVRTALEASDQLRNSVVPDLRKLAGTGSISVARAFQ